MTEIIHAEYIWNGERNKRFCAFKRTHGQWSCRLELPYLCSYQFSTFYCSRIELICFSQQQWEVYFLYYDLLLVHQYSGQALRQTCSTLGSRDNIRILFWLVFTFLLHKSNSFKLRSFPAGGGTISKWQRLLSPIVPFISLIGSLFTENYSIFLRRFLNLTSHIFHKKWNWQEE